ncbi:response regulator transcription factor [Marivivens marinus]|uniref:response regulator transcription factor n=1 Tax=Marivivens marinus TaxID=3110173 RepID=UPI003B8482CA
MVTGPATAGFSSALIIDDHPLFCDALAMTLPAVAGIGRVDTAVTLEAALTALSDGPLPDVIVLDLNLPDVSGLDGLVRLRNAVDGRPILVVSSMADHRMIGAAIRAGAAGFVPKHSQRDVFRAAFEALADGRQFVPDGVPLTGGTDAPASDQEDAVQRLSLLTRQQARILQLLCEGKLNKQIAFDLSIAETTVKAHVTAIMRKLGVQSRTQAVLLAREASFASVLQDDGGS